MTTTPDRLLAVRDELPPYGKHRSVVTEAAQELARLRERLTNNAYVTADDLLDTDDLAALLKVRPSSLRAMRAQPERHRRIDGLPAPLRLVSGRPVWVRRDVERWLQARDRVDTR